MAVTYMISAEQRAIETGSIDAHWYSIDMSTQLGYLLEHTLLVSGTISGTVGCTTQQVPQK